MDVNRWDRCVQKKESNHFKIGNPCNLYGLSHHVIGQWNYWYEKYHAHHSSRHVNVYPNPITKVMT